MVTKEDILKMSKLAKITISDIKICEFTDEINDILAFVDMIYEEDNENEEFCELNGLQNCLRQDKVKMSMTNDQALSGTSYKNEGYFVVRKGE